MSNVATVFGVMGKSLGLLRVIQCHKKSKSVQNRGRWVSISDSLTSSGQCSVDISSERLLPNYGISMDWLLCGDLKALQRMMQAPGQGSRDAREREREREREKFVRLSESEREIIRKKVDEFLEGYQ
jgi:hypothetical protein